MVGETQRCDNCGLVVSSYEPDRKDRRAWWILSGYHHVFGMFCPDCYRLVSHNASRQPENPEAWAGIVAKQRILRSVKR